MVGRSALLKGMRRPNLIDCDCDRPLTISTCNVFLQIQPPLLPFATAPQVCSRCATAFGRKNYQKCVPAPRCTTCGTAMNLHHSLCFLLASLKEDPLWHSVGKCKNNLSQKRSGWVGGGGEGQKPSFPSVATEKWWRRWNNQTVLHKAGQVQLVRVILWLNFPLCYHTIMKSVDRFISLLLSPKTILWFLIDSYMQQFYSTRQFYSAFN